VDCRSIASRLIPSHLQLIWLCRSFLGVDNRFDQSNPSRIECGLDRRTNIVSSVTTETVSTARFGEGDKIDRRQGTSIFRISDVLLLEFDFRETVVFKQDNLHGQA